MPKVLAFLPCDKVTIEEGSKNVSISGVLETIHVMVPPNTPAPPPNAAIPMNWAIYELWQGDPSDTGQFESKAVMEDPAGKQIMEGPVCQWNVITSPVLRAQNIGRVAGFPISVQGKYKLKLLFRRVGEQVFNEVVSTSIHLKYGSA
ncbi:MAG TPA: hypothetical protein VEU32_17345 [Burkholderiales bacterium]|nr:hypothetical protein [Burkholderiales bacterium]